MSKAIQDNDLLYNALSPLVQFGTRCHYHHFDVHGIENLPTDGAYIIAPCHQQALMEPLAVLCFSPKPPVFLARADIFRKPTLRAILTFLKILPVYRIRDGQENLGKNKGIFEQCSHVLLDGYPLCLMAEGRHNNCHNLLPLRKGMFRIAGETQLKLGDYPLYIVPTGIDFDDYERTYANLVVNIGTPIPVQPFMDTYRTNEPVALNLMRDALDDALRSLMHDVRDLENYNQIMTLCHLLNRNMRRSKGLKNTAWNRFRMRQAITSAISAWSSDDRERWLKAAKSLGDQCHRIHLDEHLIADHWPLVATFLALLFLAAFIVAFFVVTPLRLILLFCLLCYPLPLLPTHLIVRKKVADPQFRSSFNFGIRLILSILYAIVIAIVMACCGGAWMSRLADIGAWWGLVALAIVFLVARITAPVVNFLRDTLANCHYWLLRLFRRRSMQAIDQTRDTFSKVNVSF